jgi:hypothetical protein
MKPESTRTDVLRDLLVERVERAPEPRRSRRGSAIALVVAFAAGALVAGGTISATALVIAQSDIDYQPRDPVNSASAGGRSFVGTHDTLVGEPIEFNSDEARVLTLGVQPATATAFVLAVSCVGPGDIAIAVDGTWSMSTRCDGEGGGGASYAQLSPTVDLHQVAVALEQGKASYAVWGAWVVKQEEPEQSEAQVEALADGVVTHDEFRAGFDRYAACLLAAGFEISGTDVGQQMIAAIPSEAVDSGADLTCYVAEFREVDMEWQIAHQEPDDTQQ